jgi:hypothetical protein
VSLGEKREKSQGQNQAAGRKEESKSHYIYADVFVAQGRRARPLAMPRSPHGTQNNQFPPFCQRSFQEVLFLLFSGGAWAIFSSCALALRVLCG